MRRQMWSGEFDVEGMVAKVRDVEAERDRMWQQVLALQAEVRAVEQSPTPDTPPPPPESDGAAIRWQQQADDLAAILARLTGLGWDHPMFALVDRRARRAAAEGCVLEASVFDDPEADRAFVRPEPPPPSRPSAPESSRLSRAERRRLEREAKRRGRS